MRGMAVLGAFGLVAALVGGCALDAGESATAPADEPTREEQSAFDTSMFKFNVWTPDDGKGRGGGSQRASATLEFKDWRTSVIIPDSWTCHVTVSMPIRSNYTVITPERAAEMTVMVAEAASSTVMHSMPKWQVTGLFCKQFADTMVGIFATVPEGPTGARVTSP